VIFVHGLGREAERLALDWSPILEQIGRIGFFPLLSRDAYPEYQLLHHDDAASRSLLPRLLQEAAGRYGTSSQVCYLGGFSGGAQFTHRALLFDLDVRIPKAMVISPGTYCFPDDGRAYPFGTAPEAEGSTPPSFARLLAAELLLAVGAEDRGQPQTAPDMAVLQGEGRVQRAANWFDALREHATALGVEASLVHHVIPGAAHDFRACLANGLAQRIASFLKGD
jgi:hypothetical protein